MTPTPSDSHELRRAVRRFARPWRRRRWRELGMICAASALLLSAGVRLPMAPLTRVAILLGGALAALAFEGFRLRRRWRSEARMDWPEVEAQLRSDGALQAALENATSLPLGGLAARQFRRLLDASVAPQLVPIRPPLWLLLATSLLLFTMSLGISMAAETRGTSLGSNEPFLGSVGDATAMASLGRQGDDRAAAASAAVGELREQFARGALSAAEFAERMDRIGKNFALREEPTSNILPPTAPTTASEAASPASTSGHGVSGNANERSTFDGTKVGSSGARAWEDLPERYRTHVARYFGRQD